MAQVLILDKDRLIAKNIYFALSAEHIKCMVAVSAQSAHTLVRQKKFDLIICDIFFDGEDVFKFLKFLLQDETRPYVIYIGGIEKVDLFDDLFVKPLNMPLLVQRVKNLLNLSCQEKQEVPLISGNAAPSWKKRSFYNALSAQWNPEKGIRWNDDINLTEDMCQAMAEIMSPIIMGEFSAFNEIPKRIIAISDYEIKQYLASQLVDETRHAEAFELYLKRINAYKAYRRGVRNIYSLRFFNGMKKLKSEDEWISGLYITEILAHVLLTAYKRVSNCNLTNNLFSMVLSDEGRHISFANLYLKDIFKGASVNDKKFLMEITDSTLSLTEGMLYSFSAAYRAFNLDPAHLLKSIHSEVKSRIVENLFNDPAYSK